MQSHAPVGYRCPFCAIAKGIEADYCLTLKRPGRSMSRVRFSPVAARNKEKRATSRFIVPIIPDESYPLSNLMPTPGGTTVNENQAMETVC